MFICRNKSSPCRVLSSELRPKASSIITNRKVRGRFSFSPNWYAMAEARMV